MYFSKISLRKNFNLLKEINNNINKGIYYYHQLVWDLFHKVNYMEEKRSFLYRYENEKGFPIFYVVSQNKPFDKKEIFDVNFKNYNPQINYGNIFNFNTRINIRKIIAAEKRSKYIDGIKFALQENKKNKIKKKNNDIIHETTEKYLEKIGETKGFEIINNCLFVDNFQSHNTIRSRSGENIYFCSVDCKGKIKVKDPIKFKELLYKGIGSVKAFGCGLLMIK